MSNITITNNDLGSVLLEGGAFDFRDDTLTFTGADTYVAGTILARDSVSLKLIAFVKGGSTNENGIPKTVLTYDVVATGAGDVSVSALNSGTVRKERLVVDAVGDDSTVDAAVIDQLRDYSIKVQDVQELNQLDNQ